MDDQKWNQKLRAKEEEGCTEQNKTEQNGTKQRSVLQIAIMNKYCLAIETSAPFPNIRGETSRIAW